MSFGKSFGKVIKKAKDATLATLVSAALLVPGCKSTFNPKVEPPIQGAEVASVTKTLYMYDSLSKIGTLDYDDAEFLPDGLATTALGSVRYTQSVNFWDIGIDFGEDERDNVGHFLHARSYDDIMSYTIEFESGLRAANAFDLRGVNLNIIGKDYTITSAVLDPSDALHLQLESEDRSTILNFSAVMNDHSQGGWVYVNGELIEEASVNFYGDTSSIMQLDRIKYKLKADAVLGDLWVPPLGLLSENLDEPEGLLGLDVRYNGPANSPDVSLVKIDFSGDDEADIEVTNRESIFNDLPLVSNETGVLKWGDDDDDLCFLEGLAVTNRDYFLLDNPLANSFSHALRYDSIDTSNRVLTFTDLGTGTREITYDQTGQGYLFVGGSVFGVRVNPDSSLRIDLDGNRDYNTPQPVSMHDQHGLIISFDEDPSAKYVMFGIPGNMVDTRVEDSMFVAFRPLPGNNLEADIARVTMFALEDYNNELSQGMTRYGMFIEQYLDKDITFEVPAQQRTWSIDIIGNE